MDKIKILFLAANPVNTSPLRLGEEVSAIDDELVRARFRDKFDLEQKWAVRTASLSRHLLEIEPHIVHFSGHGSQAGQIYLEDETGKSHPIGVRALSSLFDALKDNIRCVVLNACYSETQAKAISRHIDCVIGMSKAIGDKAAIKFAQGFYQGIGYGRDLQTAFKLGCAHIDLQGLDEQDTPKMLWKNDEPRKIVFAQKKDQKEIEPKAKEKPKFTTIKDVPRYDEAIRFLSNWLQSEFEFTKTQLQPFPQQLECVMEHNQVSILYASSINKRANFSAFKIVPIDSLNSGIFNNETEVVGFRKTAVNRKYVDGFVNCLNNVYNVSWKKIEVAVNRTKPFPIFLMTEILSMAVAPIFTKGDPENLWKGSKYNPSS